MPALSSSIGQVPQTKRRRDMRPGKAIRASVALVWLGAGMLILGPVQLAQARKKSFEERVLEAVRLELRRDGGDVELLLVNKTPSPVSLGLPRLPFWHGQGDLPLQVTIHDFGE